MDILCTLRLIIFDGLGSDSAWKDKSSTKVRYAVPEEWKEPIRACKLYVCAMHLRTFQIESAVAKYWLEGVSAHAKETIHQTTPKVESIWMHRNQN